MGLSNEGSVGSGFRANPKDQSQVNIGAQQIDRYAKERKGFSTGDLASQVAASQAASKSVAADNYPKKLSTAGTREDFISKCTLLPFRAFSGLGSGLADEIEYVA